MPLLKETNIDPRNPQHALMLSDLQAGILKGNGRDHAIHLFIRFSDNVAATARNWIQERMSSLVTSADEQIKQTSRFRLLSNAGGSTKGETIVNVMLSAEGYHFLSEGQLADEKMPKDRAFRVGLKARKTKLNDPDVSAWEDPFKKNFHVLILIADNKETRLQRFAMILRQELQALDRIVLIHQEAGHNMHDPQTQLPVEHFGYADGISQPLFLKEMLDRDQAHHSGQPKRDPSATLELILARDPLGEFEHSLGTYCVYRKLEQNVTGFRHAEEELATQLHIQPEQAGAFVVGRFRDGTPVTNFFTQQQASGEPDNNFDYSADQDGGKCPFQAHIRKTNPRGDTINFVPLDEERAHRIVRRGIPYGQQPSAAPVGLLFLCLQGDIKNQFEFIQRSWVNAHNFPPINTSMTGVDALIGQDTLMQHDQRWPNQWGQPLRGTTQTDFSGFVTMKGGEYWFMPSISCLRSLDLKLTPQRTAVATSSSSHS